MIIAILYFLIYLGRKNYKKGLTTEELPDHNGELISFPSFTINGTYDTVGELAKFLDGKVTTSVDYARYWHGYEVVLRVLLLFFDISVIRMLLLFVFATLLVTLFILLKRKFGIAISIIFAASLIVYDYLFIAFSLQGAPIFLTMMISCIILLTKFDKIKSIYLYFFIIGCISNFVDFLTVPLITFAMPMFIYILSLQKSENFSCKKAIKTLIGSLILWGLGYVSTWVSKWLIYDIFYNKDLLSSAISQVLYRSGYNDLSVYSSLGNILDLLINISLIFIRLYLLGFGFCLLFLSIDNKIHFKILHFSSYLKEIAPILIVTILPFIWYVALANHTTIHSYFVHRNMLIFLTGSLICITKSVSLEKKTKK